MTTSIHQRKMYRIPPNHPVRRRLDFGESTDDEARVDNFTNILQESITNEVKEKSKRWNFDFKNEEALKGRYEWSRVEGDEWVVMKPSDAEYSPQHDNENTPVHNNTGILRPIRKRRINIERNGYAVKRQMKFN